MFEKPTSLENKEGQKERAIQFTGQELSDYAEQEPSLISSKFKVKTTTMLIGLFMAFGAMGESAQAQDWRWYATRGVESVMVDAERAKSQQYLEEFNQELERITQAQLELRKNYDQKREALSEKNDEASLKKLDKDFQTEWSRLEAAKQKNLDDYKKKMNKQRNRQQVTDILRNIVQ